MTSSLDTFTPAAQTADSVPALHDAPAVHNASAIRDVAALAIRPARTHTGRAQVLRDDRAQLAELIPVHEPPERSTNAVHSLDDLLDAARRTGFEYGYEAATAIAAASENERLAGERQQLHAAADLLATAASSLRAAEARCLSHLADEAGDLAVELTRVLLDHELRHTSDAARSALGRALALAPADGPVVIRIHPEDAAQLTDLEILTQGRSVRLVHDATVERSGCVVNAGATRIDAQIGTALDRVRAALRAGSDA